MTRSGTARVTSAAVRRNCIGVIQERSGKWRCVLLALLLATAACGPEPQQALQQVYVAPATASLRSQLGQRSGTVAVLKHGDRAGVIDVRRRFVRVRTPGGTEGWLDSGELLSEAEMSRIRDERKAAAELASEGNATAYEALNIHLEANRKSPAFAQIPEGGSVEVLERKLAPRTGTMTRATVVFEKPKPARSPRREARKSKSASRQPPKPPAPTPPANWRAPFGEPEEKPAPTENAAAKEKAKPAMLESWTLMRTKNHEIGWVLSRNLMMSIPDDVAQYAGGAHITSYFDLGTVQDERDGEKHNWLWTTASTGEAADFNAWRVFLWNRRRHRYETSYRKRDLEGFFPVDVDPADKTRSGRGFQIITKDDDGEMRRRTYYFDGMLVHLTDTEEYSGLQAGPENEPLTAKEQGSWLARTWAAWKARWQKK